MSRFSPKVNALVSFQKKKKQKKCPQSFSGILLKQAPLDILNVTPSVSGVGRVYFCVGDILTLSFSLILMHSHFRVHHNNRLRKNRYACKLIKRRLMTLRLRDAFCPQPNVSRRWLWFQAGKDIVVSAVVVCAAVVTADGHVEPIIPTWITIDSTGYFDRLGPLSRFLSAFRRDSIFLSTKRGLRGLASKLD